MNDATPATPVSSGHVGAEELAVIARADRVRAHDRTALRVARRVLQWLLVFTVFVVAPFACIVGPNVMRFPCRSKQSEAKGNLRALYVAEESYRAEYGHYGIDQEALGWTARGARVRYDYFVKASGHDATGDARFQAWAVGRDDDVAGDVWRETDGNVLENVVNACAR